GERNRQNDGDDDEDGIFLAQQGDDAFAGGAEHLPDADFLGSEQYGVRRKTEQAKTGDNNRQQREQGHYFDEADVAVELIVNTIVKEIRVKRVDRKSTR